MPTECTGAGGWARATRALSKALGSHVCVRCLAALLHQALQRSLCSIVCAECTPAPSPKLPPCAQCPQQTQCTLAHAKHGTLRVQHARLLAGRRRCMPALKCCTDSDAAADCRQDPPHTVVHVAAPGAALHHVAITDSRNSETQPGAAAQRSGITPAVCPAP